MGLWKAGECIFYLYDFCTSIIAKSIVLSARETAIKPVSNRGGASVFTFRFTMGL